MQTLAREEILSRNWSTEEVLELFKLPFCDLLLKAQTIHRENHQANAIQLARLLSIKTGACPEDCAYCPQSSRYKTNIEQAPLMPLKQVIAAAKKAKESGAQRFCMGAAWRSPTERQLDDVIEHVQAVKELGLETCVTLGMLKNGQAERLKAAGLDYYNHNIDTAPEYYREIINTRTFQDRIDTLKRVRKAGLKVCCGGIVGMGESRTIRAGLLATLASLDPYPESVPINQLVKVTGTPMENADDLDPIEFVKTICVARIIMPKTIVRLSAGRESMSDSTQALCFMAGASSIFMGEQLLTTANPDVASDQILFNKLGLTASTEHINEPFTTKSAAEISEIF